MHVVIQSRMTSAERVTWLVNRLRSAKPSEIVSRSVEAFRHLALAMSRKNLQPLPAECPVGTSLYLESGVLERVAEEEKNRIRVLAGGWLDHRGSFFTLTGALLGDRIDWHRDYSSGLIGPKKYSAFINHRNAAEVGDVKYIWELNRLQHLVLLALASVWSDSDEFGKEIRDQTLSWYEQNPFMIGLNWKSPLEAGLRLISWALVSSLSGRLHRDDVFQKDFIEVIYRHQYFISKFHSKHSSANNHLIGEMAGLYIASVFWPCFRESDSWRWLARQKLIEEMARQVEDDGVGKERATEYQLFILEFFILAGALGHAIGDHFPANYWDRIGRMAAFLSAISDRSGNLPLFGDGDSGQVISLPQSTQERVRSLLQIFQPDQRQDHLNERNLRSRLLLWGEASGTMPLPSVPNSDMCLQAFPKGGYYALATDRGSEHEVIVVFDTGPLGFSPLYAHGHADALSFWLSYGGHEFLIDPGTFTYYTNEEWREYFRSTAAHNTVRIDGLDQSVPGGRFLWRHIARSHAEHAENNDECVKVRGFHDGYCRLSDPAIHRRDLRLDKRTRLLMVTDFLECKGNHDVEIFFHFSEQCQVRQVAPALFTALNGDRSLTIRLDARLQPTLCRGSEKPISGWVSRKFGVKEPSFTLTGRARINGSTQFLSEIIPI